MSKRPSPFNIMRTARENLLDWTGEDSRIMMLIEHCDSHGVTMQFLPGRDYCYIDVLSADGTVLHVRGEMHSMTIDLDRDIITLFGSQDIATGIVYIEQLVEAEAENREISEDLRSLLEL